MFDQMPTLSLDFIGWFYTLACALVIVAGGVIMLFLQANNQLAARYKNYSIWNDVMLMVIWAIGLAGGIGVLDRSVWGQFLLQLFCWMLIALVATSGASRLYTLRKLGRGITRQDWIHSLIGVVLVVAPIVLFCLGTVLSLKSEDARRAFGIH
jgi:hypothetical protein